MDIGLGKISKAATVEIHSRLHLCYVCLSRGHTTWCVSRSRGVPCRQREARRQKKEKTPQLNRWALA
jgi:hypothetical protein